MEVEIPMATPPRKFTVDYSVGNDRYDVTLWVNGVDFIYVAAQDPDIRAKNGEELVSALVERGRGFVVGVSRGKNDVWGNGPRNEPAEIQFYEDGTVKRTEYRANGKINDLDDGTAAITSYHPNGRLASISRYKNGRLNDTPAGDHASVSFDEKGQMIRAESFKDGVSQGVVPNGEHYKITIPEEKSKIAYIASAFSGKMRFKPY